MSNAARLTSGHHSKWSLSACRVLPSPHNTLLSRYATPSRYRSISSLLSFCRPDLRASPAHRWNHRRSLVIAVPRVACFSTFRNVAGAPRYIAMAQKEEVFVGAIDQGTTSSRFLIFNKEGEPVAEHQEVRTTLLFLRHHMNFVSFT